MSRKRAWNLNPRAPAAQKVDVVEPWCIECSNLGVLTRGDKVYPHRPDLHALMFYVCVCGARVGCHPGTTRPMGYPAGPATARLRDRAHRVFDAIWKEKARRLGTGRHKCRDAAYRWLAAELGILEASCHISHFDAAMCKRVIEICKPYADRISRKRQEARACSTAQQEAAKATGAGERPHTTAWAQRRAAASDDEPPPWD